MTPRLLRSGAALMLIALSACDNVRWGGADVTIVSPPPRTAAGVSAVTDEEAGVRMPTGAVLYYVRRGEDATTMRPVAEIDGDTLLAILPGADPETFGNRFIADHLRQGAEFVLFANGVRVGTFVVQGAEMPQFAVCPRVPQAVGLLELAQGTEEVVEMLALARNQAPQVARRLGTPTQPTRSMQVIGPILAERIMRARRAPLPGNWQRAMQQLRPFPVGAAGEMGFAATFLVGDELGPGGNDEGHSTFFIGAPRQTTFDTVFVDFTVYQQAGKRAPRVIDFLDWSRSGQVELLLEVYSVDQSWFEAVGRDQAGRWRRIFDGRCPAGGLQQVPQGEAVEEEEEEPGSG
jgi:hypothetical protein